MLNILTDIGKVDVVISSLLFHSEKIKFSALQIYSDRSRVFFAKQLKYMSFDN